MCSSIKGNELHLVLAVLITIASSQKELELLAVYKKRKILNFLKTAVELKSMC